MNTIYMYVFDTLADWEPGFALAELHSGRYFKSGTPAFQVKTVGPSTNPITTLGGVRISPDITVDDLSPDDAALLLLPGGTTWMNPCHAPILSKTRDFLSAGIPVAAICGATIALASVGLLDDVAHTSNHLGFMKSVCPSYRGEALYSEAPAVIGNNVITAGGFAPIDFAHAIFKKLDVMSPECLEAWLNLYKTQEAKYFAILMNATSWKPGEA